MNFFDMESEPSQITINPFVWVFFAASLVLTAITLLLYYWMLRRNGQDRRTPECRSRSTQIAGWAYLFWSFRRTQEPEKDHKVQCLV